MATNVRDQEVLFRLLKEYSTLPEMRRFLGERKLPRTATAWPEMIETRLLPPLENGRITREDLIAELRDNEEHTRQHVFLYETRNDADARQFISEKRIAGILKTSGLEGIAEHPKLVGMPPSPTIVDARFEGTDGDRQFVLKIIEKRIIRRTRSQREEGNTTVIEYEDVPVRAVNVFRLDSRGQLELRIEAYTNDTEYSSAVKEMWEYGKSFFQRNRFEEVSLQRAKRRLGTEHANLTDEVRFSSFAGRDDTGNTYRFGSGGWDKNLFDSKATERSLVALGSDTRWDHENIWFRKRDGQPLPSREIHVLLGGASINEFALTASSSKPDYEYVLGRIRYHNR